MVGIRANRLELDELWSFVGKKQRRVERHELFAKGDHGWHTEGHRQLSRRQAG